MKPTLILAIRILLVLSTGTASTSRLVAQEAATSALYLAKFDIDVTPPVGSMMAYDRVRRVEELGLRCRGIVLHGDLEPIVLCAVDWIGIGNGAHDAFCERLADAAQTSVERVAVHTLHQHDAPRCDFTAEQLLHQAGVSDLGAHDGSFSRQVLDSLHAAVSACMKSSVPIDEFGFGAAEVDKVASNRRILGPDGKVSATRYTTTRSAELRALPEGTIDPELSCLSFWSDGSPVAVLTYYACHPQSYYRTGIPSPDFPGIARFMRGQDMPDVLQVHFNGAGGNIGAGKFNDGAKENRLLLAHRVASGMKQAFENTTRQSVTSQDVRWHTVPVALPVGDHLKREELQANLADWNAKDYWGSPEQLAWVLRCEAGHKISLGCLSILDTCVLHMPGELFVEYQLAAKEMTPELNVAMAAYGDYGPGYIGTKIAYSQGGYETSARASKVSPDCEKVLMDGMQALLKRVIDGPQPGAKQ